MSVEIERSLRAALTRLLTGRPTHPAVKARLLAGRSIVTGVCLEEESGHRRSLFQHQNCSFPRIYQMLQAARGSSVPGRVNARLKDLEREVDALKRDNAILRTVNASLVIEVGTLRDAEERRESNRFRRKDKRKGSR